MYRTKTENFLNLQSLMKHDFCLKHVLRHFKDKTRLKCFDETGPWFFSFLITGAIQINVCPTGITYNQKSVLDKSRVTKKIYNEMYE